VDALERTFRLQRAIRYVPDPPTEPIGGPGEAGVTVKVGTWTAKAIAEDLVVGSGLTVDWRVRDYTFVTTFDGIGTLYELLRRLVEPWDQTPLGVDITGVGTVVHIRPRLLHPPADLTMTVAESRLVDIELGPRRRLPLIGLVVLEGRPSGWNFLPSEPPIPESSTVTTPYAIPVYDLGGNLISQVDGERTYRQPDNLLLKHVQRESQKNALSGIMEQVKEETTETTYEPTSYGPQGPLTQPLPLRALKTIKTLIPIPVSAPGTIGGMYLGESAREEVIWKYNTRRFLVATTTRRYRRTETYTEGSPVVVTFPEVERIEETRNEKVTGWLEIATTRTTFDPVTGKASGSVTLQGQDAAGLAPGGVRPPASFSSSGGGQPAPGRVTETISTDPTAIPVRYANVNLTREDLDVILEQYRAVSGLVEYQLKASGPAIPDVMKGMAIHLTEYRDADGTLIPLDPAQVRRIGFGYVDTRDSSEYTCSLDAVFYRPA
jgi:hypothetical protein